MSNKKHILNIGNILGRIGDIIGSQKNVDIAGALGVEPTVSSNWKSRGRTPWLNLLSFCLENNISFTWLLTGKEIQKPAPGSTISDKARDLYPEFAKVEARLAELAEDGESDYIKVAKILIQDLGAEILRLESKKKRKKKNGCVPESI